MQIDVGCLKLFMPQPKCDRGSIDTVLKQFHCCCMPQCVWCDLFSLQGWAPLCGDGEIFFEQIAQAVMSQVVAALVGEHAASRIVRAFAQPCLECRT